MVAVVAGAVAALAIGAVAMAHPGLGLVDRVDVLARVLGLSPEQVEQARDAGTLRALLGDVTRDELAAARTEASAEAIEGALAAGTITAAQAERLRALTAGDGTFVPGDAEQAPREGLRELRGVLAIDTAAVYAAVLGVTVEQVEQARADGTLRTLLADADRVALTAALVDARDAAIAAALASGEITADQAELLEGSRFGGGRGFGGRHFQGRHAGGDCRDGRDGAVAAPASAGA